MTDYTIYKITCRNTGKCYIGRTSKPLLVRLNEHITETRNGNNKTMSRLIINGGNFEMIPLEKCIAEEKVEREKYHIMQNKNICVNRCTPWTNTDPEWKRKEKYEKTGIQSQTTEEYNKKYKEMNRDRVRDYNRDYYTRNRDKLTEKQTCPTCAGQYCVLSKWSHERTQGHKRAVAILNFLYNSNPRVENNEGPTIAESISS